MNIQSAVVCITGAGSGIGRATAFRFAEAGWRVAVVDIDGMAAQAVANQIRVAGGDALACVADVGSEKELSAAIISAAQNFGGMDALVNNAAVVAPGPIETQTMESWDRVLSVGPGSAFNAVRYALPYLAASSVASITNVASVDALQGESGVASYCAAKGALLSLTRALAIELADRYIRVNCVCPGVTDTPQTRGGLGAGKNAEHALGEILRRVPMGRLLRPEEIAEVIYFLASPSASAMTGSVSVVDGGLTAGWR